MDHLHPHGDHGSLIRTISPVFPSRRECRWREPACLCGFQTLPIGFHRENQRPVDAFPPHRLHTLHAKMCTAAVCCGTALMFGARSCPHTCFPAPSSMFSRNLQQRHPKYLYMPRSKIQKRGLLRSETRKTNNSSSVPSDDTRSNLGAAVSSCSHNNTTNASVLYPQGCGDGKFPGRSFRNCLTHTIYIPACAASAEQQYCMESAPGWYLTSHQGGI